MGKPTNQDVARAFDAIAKGGTVVLTGMADMAEPVGIPIHLLAIAGMQKSIKGALFGMCSPPVDILRQIDLYRAGKLLLDEMITRRYALDDINVAVDDLLEGRNIRGVVCTTTDAPGPPGVQRWGGGGRSSRRGAAQGGAAHQAVPFAGSSLRRGSRTGQDRGPVIDHSARAMASCTLGAASTGSSPT